MRLKIYLDTSVLNFYFANEAPEEMDITKKFFEEIKRKTYDASISDVVIREVSEAMEPKRTKLLNLVEDFSLEILPLDLDCEGLADRFVEHGLIPTKYRDDAVHIAVAVINEMDVVVSWNLEHMVKLKTIQGVNSISRELGYKEIDIRTPGEMLP